MNTKIINLLERHVEKIVLAVAIAGAGFIAWSGMQPTTLPNDPTMTAGSVEDKVTAAVKSLEDARKATLAIPESRLTSALHDYVADYNRIMLHHPLSENLVASTNMPRFGPEQEPLEGVVIIKDDTTKIVSAQVPAPKNVTAMADRASVLPPPADPNQPVPPPTPGAPGGPQPVDKNWVCVSGDIPWGDYVNSFKNLPANQRLPDEQQHNVLAKVDVERRALTPTGWTTWEKVPGTNTSPGGAIPDIDWNSLNDADWISMVSQLDSSFQKVAEPLFYWLAPKDPTTQAPTPILAPNVKALAPPTATPGATVVPGTPPKPGMPPHPVPPGGIAGHPPIPMPVPDDSENPNPTPMQAVPGLTLDVNQLKQSGTVPFWFWDETVQAGQQYQYRVRLVMYNPLYRYPQPQRLVNPDTAKEGTMTSAWVVVTNPVEISGDLAFFIESPMGNGPTDKVQFHVFKWTNGGWYEDQWTREVGQPVSGRIQLVDKTPPSWVEVDTKYTLVDVQSAPGDLIAVLLSPTGELVTHSAQADRSQFNPDRAKKETDRVKAIGKAPVPKPAGTTGTTGTVRPNPRGIPNNPDNQ